MEDVNFGIIVHRRITMPVAKLVQNTNAISLCWGNDHEMIQDRHT